MPTLESNGITLAYEITGAGHPLLLITGVGYGKWTHIDGWSESVLEYIRALESPANGWVN